MARTHVIHDDGTQEMWDSEEGYIRWDAEQVEVESRPLTEAERLEVDPKAAVQALQEVVDQMLLDQLMNSMMADLGEL